MGNVLYTTVKLPDGGFLNMWAPKSHVLTIVTCPNFG